MAKRKKGKDEASPPKEIPKVALMMKEVDAGSAVIGLIECPNCGQDHYTTWIRCGVRDVYCGVNKFGKDGAVRPDGYSTVDVQVIV